MKHSQCKHCCTEKRVGRICKVSSEAGFLVQIMHIQGELHTVSPVSLWSWWFVCESISLSIYTSHIEVVDQPPEDEKWYNIIVIKAFTIIGDRISSWKIYWDFNTCNSCISLWDIDICICKYSKLLDYSAEVFNTLYRLAAHQQTVTKH